MIIAREKAEFVTVTFMPITLLGGSPGLFPFLGPVHLLNSVRMLEVNSLCIRVRERLFGGSARGAKPSRERRQGILGPLEEAVKDLTVLSEKPQLDDPEWFFIAFTGATEPTLPLLLE